MPQRILQLHQLNKQIMLRIESRCSHRRLEVKTQPLLNAKPAKLRAALRQIHKQNQIKHNRRRQNKIPTKKIPTKKIPLNLHRITKPPKYIDVVPAFFVVASWGVIVYSDFVGEVAVE